MGFLSSPMRIEASGPGNGRQSEKQNFETYGDIHEGNNKVVQDMRKAHTRVPK